MLKTSILEYINKQDMKRYEILKENISIGAADLHKDIYKIIGTSQQNFHVTIKNKIGKGVFKFKNIQYEIIDKLNQK